MLAANNSSSSSSSSPRQAVTVMNKDEKHQNFPDQLAWPFILAWDGSVGAFDSHVQAGLRMDSLVTAALTLVSLVWETHSRPLKL